jgi:tetratricopeptide (TPR) repeat protein
LCIAAALVIITFGFIHIITGVVSPYGLPYDIVRKDSFGYRETLVNAEKIKALPYLAAKKKYPIGCRVLQREDYMESGTVFETRMARHLQTDMKKWQAEFSAESLTAELSPNSPWQQWQNQLQGQTNALQTDPEDPNACNNRGIAAAREGQYETAIAEFTRAFRRDPVFTEAFYNRALVYVALGQLGPAISDLTKVIEIEPSLAEGYTRRGLLHVAMSQYDQAISDFTKVLEIDPASAETYFRRSLAFYAKGQYDKAWEDVQRIQDLGLHVPAEFVESLRAASGLQEYLEVSRMAVR